MEEKKNATEVVTQNKEDTHFQAQWQEECRGKSKVHLRGLQGKRGHQETKMQ